jgi:hypothetical protein
MRTVRGVSGVAARFAFDLLRLTFATHSPTACGLSFGVSSVSKY